LFEKKSFFNAYPGSERNGYTLVLLLF